ncbi:MAG: glycosyltransferase family 39 protein [bacterium]|nr:glycosyltransferase family 39 protein [bacterium]
MKRLRSRYIILLSSLLTLIITLRFISLGSLSLIDPSEGRYALISKLMLETGNFLMPQVVGHDGVMIEFWGKPPLFFWATALSYYIFGINEFSARIPSFLSMLAVIGSCFFFARHFWGSITAILTALILSSSVLFYIYGGLCQVDMLLTTSVSIAMLGFARYVDAKARARSYRWWGCLFFISLAVGFIVKGPIAVVLPGVSVVLWTLWTRRWSDFFRLPYFTGGLIFLLITTPWFYFAEQKSPGFLYYFFFQENILRYATNQYGDKYGTAHPIFYGASWLFVGLAFFPWTFYILADAWNRCRNSSTSSRCTLNWTDKLALCWGITPPLFFCFSNGLLIGYMLPALPGLALYLSRRFSRKDLTAVLRLPKLTLTLNIAIIRILCVTTVTVFLAALGFYISVEPFKENFSLVAAVIVCSILVIFVVNQTLSHPRHFVEKLTLCTVMAVSSATFSISGYLSDSSSTTELLTRLVEQNTGRHLNFPFGIPYSAFVYSPLKLESDLAEAVDSDDNEREIVAIPKKKLSTLEEQLALSDDHDLIQSFRTPNWIVYHKN